MTRVQSLAQELPHSVGMPPPQSFLNKYINTKEIYNTENSENILVQGIIDLYYINQNDELILVDYKTDYTQDEGKDLVDKYKVQLEIYKIT